MPKCTYFRWVAFAGIMFTKPINADLSEMIECAMVGCLGTRIRQLTFSLAKGKHKTVARTTWGGWEGQCTILLHLVQHGKGIVDVVRRVGHAMQFDEGRIAALVERDFGSCILCAPEGEW